MLKRNGGTVMKIIETQPDAPEALLLMDELSESLEAIRILKMLWKV